MSHFYHTRYDIKVFEVQLFCYFNKFGLLTPKGNAAKCTRCDWKYIEIYLAFCSKRLSSSEKYMKID